MASIAVPTLRLSKNEVDFGTCLVGQAIEMHVTLFNPSQSASAWIVYKGKCNLFSFASPKLATSSESLKRSV